jgi:hypothetical protein
MGQFHGQHMTASILNYWKKMKVWFIHFVFHIASHLGITSWKGFFLFLQCQTLAYRIWWFSFINQRYLSKQGQFFCHPAVHLSHPGLLFGLKRIFSLKIPYNNTTDLSSTPLPPPRPRRQWTTDWNSWRLDTVDRGGCGGGGRGLPELSGGRG